MTLQAAVTTVELVEREAIAARKALASLEDERIGAGLRRAADLLAGRAAEVLAANAEDISAATGLDDGALDRLRLDERRFAAIGDGLRATSALEPIAREVGSWQLANGLRVAERRIPVGVIGANFEARPGVAADIAAQVLKSGNAVVLRTGAAALRTVTLLVDDVLRPALAEAGVDPAAVGLVRTPAREGAEALVSLPRAIPLVILRGSGASTAALATRAAAMGVRTLAHAEGGGVLYAHAAASPARLERIVRASLDRLGVCNRLNLALVDRDAPVLAALVETTCETVGVEVRGTAANPLDRPLGHEWAAEPGRVATVTLALVEGVDDALALANEQTSGLAAAIVTEDEDAARRFLDGYRGTTAYWNATTRFTDGFALLGAPETGINVDRFPGPRGPVSYRDLWLRQYRVIGDGSETR